MHSVETTIERNLIATNAGNLVFLDAAWKLLSAPGVEITPDGLAVGPGDADLINERYDAYVIPLANAFRNSYEPALAKMTQLVRRLRIPVVVLGVGAQGTVDYDFSAIKPIERTVRAFMGAVLDRSPSVGVRGEATLAYLNALGFRDVDVVGCPSMFMWGDALRVERKAPALDERSRVVITISPYRTAMGRIALRTLARYPRLVYVAQDLDTLRLLVDGTPLRNGTPDAALPLHPQHPYFRERRTRFYIEPWSWIDDLRRADFVFGTRIHGGIAALLAGTPATVLAHDSRTLELARYFAIPHRLLRDTRADVDPGAPVRGGGRRRHRGGARRAVCDVHRLPRAHGPRPRLRPRRRGGRLRPPGRRHAVRRRGRRSDARGRSSTGVADDAPTPLTGPTAREATPRQPDAREPAAAAALTRARRPVRPAWRPPAWCCATP